MSRGWRRRLFELVRDRVGIELAGEVAAGSVDRLVHGRVDQLGLRDPAAWLDLLESEPPEGDQFRALLSVVAIGQTHFFRDRGQLEALAEELRAVALREGRRVNLWSAACSTGEEPWSLAMLLAELGVDAHVLATDINEESLAAAERGVYGSWGLRHVEPRWRSRYLVARGEEMAVGPRLRDMVSYQPYNLVRGAPPRPPEGLWDAIVLRNVCIYFGAETISSVVRRLADTLRPQGVLVMGASESLHALDFVVGRVIRERVVYQRADAGPPVARLTETTWPAPLPAPPLPHREHPTTPPDRRAAWTESPPPRGVVRGWDAAEQALASGDRVGVRAALKGLAEDGGDLRALLTLANLDLQDHDFAAALKRYEAARRRDALLPEVHVLLGVLHRKTGQLREAKRCLRRALFLDPDDWRAAFLLAGVYGRLGREDARRRELARVEHLLDRGLSFVAPTASLASPLDELRPREVRRAVARRSP